MKDLRQAAQQALEALETCSEDEVYSDSDFGMVQVYDEDKVTNAITALRAALAEPEQEPVGWLDTEMQQAYTTHELADAEGTGFVPLYTAPHAPTPRKPLHDMAVFDLADEHLYEGDKNYGVLAFARAIEKAHGIGEQK